MRDAIVRSAFLGGPEKARALAERERGPPRHGRLGPGPARGRVSRCSTRTDSGGRRSVPGPTGATADAVSLPLPPRHQEDGPPGLRHARPGAARWRPQSPLKAASAYLAAADLDPEAAPRLRRPRSARATRSRKGRRGAKAVAALERALALCPSQAPQALLRLGQVQEARGETKAAAAAYDRLDRDFPASPQAQDGAARLRALGRARAGRDARRPFGNARSGRERLCSTRGRTRRRWPPSARPSSAVPRATRSTSRGSVWAGRSSPKAAPGRPRRI